MRPRCAQERLGRCARTAVGRVGFSVQALETRQPIRARLTLLRGFYAQVTNFLKVAVVWPNHVPVARKIFETGLAIPNLGHRTFLTYESNVVFVMRYMVDTGILGANWVTLPAGAYLPRTNNKASTCQVEVDVWWNMVESHAPDGEWLKIAPLRTLSFDIECAGRKGHFPEAEKDPVIQIANWVSVQVGFPARCPLVFLAWVLGRCH